MKPLPFLVGLAALSLIASARAQEAGDCDMMCRLQGYLSSDHMTTAAGELPAAAPAKPRRTRAAPVRKPSLPATRAVAAAPGPAVAEAPPASRRPGARSARPPAVSESPAPPKALPPARVAVMPLPKAAPRPAGRVPVPAARVARPAPHPAAATRTASFTATIPGSAASLQAGFH